MGIKGTVDAPPESLASVRERHAAELADLERAAIAAALKYTENDRTEAAQILGISRQTLYTLCARLGMTLPDVCGRGRVIADRRHWRRRRRQAGET